MNNIDAQYILTNLLNSAGNLNPRALESHGIDKETCYQIFHKMSGPQLCKTCGQPTSFLSFKKGYTLYCSNSCMGKSSDIQDKKNKTMVEKYGQNPYLSPAILDKKKQTSIRNYGVEHPSKSKDFQDNKKKNCFEKHGVDHVGKLTSVIEKRKNTCLEKYGVEYPTQDPKVYKKVADTNIKKYGVPTVLLLSKNRNKALDSRRPTEIYDCLNDKEWLLQRKDVPSTLIAKQLGIAHSTILNYFQLHQIERPPIIVSKFEHEIVEFLESFGILVETSNRTILNGKEIDIYLPKYQIGIELNGVYWHTDKFIADEMYHFNKTKLAESKQIQLIHILDHEWTHKNTLVKERLLSKLGLGRKIYARKCDLSEVSDSQYTAFMDSHHIQGKAAASIRLGLFYENVLVAIMSFSKSRFNKRYQWELIRYASNGTIVGGASKLFKYFVKTYFPTSIVSYSDNRWNSGKMYEKLGMAHEYTTSPNYSYFDGEKLESRQQYQKHMLKNKLRVYNESLTENENMKANGYYRLWDCGNKVFTWVAK